MQTLLYDLRFAIRQLRKDPAFTLVVVISLALAIGANTTIFTFVNSFLLRPPAVEDAGQLRELWNQNTKGSGVESYLPLSYPDYLHYRDDNQAFSGLMAFDGEMRPTSWSSNGAGEMVQGQLVSGNFFSVLGVRPVLGRTFLTEEDQVSSAQPVIVVSYPFWQERLGADRAVLGKTLTLNGTKFTVVGVSPANFSGIIVGNKPDFWAPLTTTPLLTHDNNFLASPSSFWLFAVGRLRTGITASQAQANLSTLSYALQQAAPDSHRDVQAATFPVKLVPEPFRGYVSAFTALLMVVVGMVLLIACANVASLLLAKGTAQVREVAIRSALGATRARLIRQRLTESVLLSVVSGIFGALLAVWVVPLLLALTPPSLPVRVDAPLDWRVLCFTFALALITGLFFGLLPALRSSRLELAPALKAEAYVAALSRSRLRSVLVVVQVAVCMVLLIGAGLCVRSLINAQSIDPGFDTRHVVIAQLDPGTLGYSEIQGKNFYQQLLQRVEALPGVTSASLTGFLPLGTASSVSGFSIDGYQAPAGQKDFAISLMNVGPDFFQTMNIPLLQGREFAERDKDTVIINEAMAQRFWPGQNPVGMHIRRVDHQQLEIVGVVSTGKYRTLSESAEPFLYLPIGYRSRSTLVVRTQMDPKALLGAVRREIQTLDPNVVPVDLETMKEYMELPLFPARTTGLLLGTAGLLALVLAVTGLYGVISYAVSQRIHEIGVRMALGAGRADIIRMVVRQGLLLTLTGAAIGLAGAFAVTRVLSSLLYGIGATDAATFATVSFLLIAVAVLASYIPARRAAKVDPMVALRYE
jgi:predicted permease